MLFKILADIVVVIHLVWILFLICGAFWGARHRTVRIVHLSGLVFALILQVFNWYCPLTHLEFWLRAYHDPSLTYSGSFIIYYLEKIIYIELSRGLIFILSILLFVFNTWVYFRMKRDGKVRE